MSAIPALDPTTAASGDEAALVAALRDGDEDAFAALVDRYGPLMLRVARVHVRTRACAEEVVQDTWTAVVAGIERFEGRSTLKTWLMRILTNRAKSEGERERRSVPFSALAGAGDDEPAVAPERLFGADHRRAVGGWAAPASDWHRRPAECALMRETLAGVGDAIGGLPSRQRAVLVLRDVEGFSADEACASLHVSEGNQRVLLHRARARIRVELEAQLSDADAGPPAAPRPRATPPRRRGTRRTATAAPA